MLCWFTFQTKASATSPNASPLPALKKTGGITSDGLTKSLAADAHTLMKTDKRRYCKVCAASCRKANNGRPPQSRLVINRST